MSVCVWVWGEGTPQIQGHKESFNDLNYKMLTSL